MEFFDRFKKKEKRAKAPKTKMVTQKTANLFVSGLLFFMVGMILIGTLRNFTAASTVGNLKKDVLNLQQEQRTNEQKEGEIDLPLIQRYMESFVPTFMNVDFSNRKLVEERFETLNDFFAFDYDNMSTAIDSNMSRTLKSSELLSVRAYNNFDLAQYKVTYVVTEERMINEQNKAESVSEEQGSEKLADKTETSEAIREEKVDAEYREEMASGQKEEEKQKDKEPVAESKEMEQVTKEVTTVLNIPFIQKNNQITIISQPYFTSESSFIGETEAFEKMKVSDSSQDMLNARVSIEKYLPIFFERYAESDETALSLLMKDVVLMGGDFVVEEVDVSQARYKFVGENVLVQVEVAFKGKETNFTHTEPFTLLLKEQANSWFVVEMHHLFIE